MVHAFALVFHLTKLLRVARRQRAGKVDPRVESFEEGSWMLHRLQTEPPGVSMRFMLDFNLKKCTADRMTLPFYFASAAASILAMGRSTASAARDGERAMGRVLSRGGFDEATNGCLLGGGGRP